jgi:hypothetical protein
LGFSALTWSVAELSSSFGVEVPTVSLECSRSSSVILQDNSLTMLWSSPRSGVTISRIWCRTPRDEFASCLAQSKSSVTCTLTGKPTSDLIFTVVMAALERCDSQRLGPKHDALRTALPGTGYLPHVCVRRASSRRANKFLDFSQSRQHVINGTAKQHDKDCPSPRAKGRDQAWFRGVVSSIR